MKDLAGFPITDETELTSVVRTSSGRVYEVPQDVADDLNKLKVDNISMLDILEILLDDIDRGATINKRTFLLGFGTHRKLIKDTISNVKEGN